MNILCYGDSNTWGYVPNIEGYSKDAVMQKYREQDCWWFKLKENHDVQIDGVCGRCIAHDNRWLKNRNAMQTIKNDLNNHQNSDLIIVQLGTNDCKSEYDDTAKNITQNLHTLLKIIKVTTGACIAIISPAIIREDNKITRKYYYGAEQKSAELDKLYAELASKENYIFISGKDLEVGEDGEHLTKQGHQQLSNQISTILGYLNKIVEFEK